MTSTADELLVALEPLPHADRLRLTAVTAHRLAARGALRPLLTALDARGPYERRLAALAALTGGDTGHMEARLADPDPVVRRYALRGARRLPVPDAAVEAAYVDAPAVVRADLARLLRDGQRSELAERLVLRARTEYGDPDAARLLAGCSPQFTARLLPELAGGLAFEDWSTLAGRHPAAVLDHAARELGDLPAHLRDSWWKRHATALAAALPAAPGRVLDLLERHAPDRLPSPVHDLLGDLVAHDAERITHWLADPDRMTGRWERTPGRAVLRQLAAADPPSLPALAARWFHRDAFRDLLRSMAPARRPAFVDAVLARHPGDGGHARAGILALLPAAERHARARATIEELRAAHSTSWDLWRPIALLPPAEARPELLAALRTGDPEERGTVWDRLVANAGFSRDPRAVAEALALAADRLANERDPVREEALAAFADLPPALLVEALEAGACATPGTPTAPSAPTGSTASAESAGGRTGSDCLERLCRDALRARDCSARTRETIRNLAMALLAASDTPAAARAAAPRTAVRILGALTTHTGTVDLGPPGSLPTGGSARTALDAFRPWLDRDAADGDPALLLALVTSCGPRAQGVPELQERLEQALPTCPDARFGEVAAAWLADPATRGDRAAALLAREPSAAFLAPVLAVLAAQRTDLLDQALTSTPPPGGRFPQAGTPRPLPPFRYADRWLPRQQEAAVRLAAAAVAEPGRGLDERAAVLRAVAPVPRYGRALLQCYTAPADHVDPALTAAALDAAAHTDDPASVLGALLDHAGDDRAAAAWSAAGRAAAHARPTRVAALLRDVLTRETGVKVTVRKAAARLAARHLPPHAATGLLSTVGRAPGVHPDVHATVVGLATTLLPSQEMWALLESAVIDGPDAARRAVLDLGPADLAPAHRSRYGELVARLPFTADRLTAQQALGSLADWARHTPSAGAALADVYTDFASPLTEWRARYGLTRLAQSDLPHPLGGVRPGSLLHGVVDRLLAQVIAGEPQGCGPEGDLPARRRLHALIGTSIDDRPMCAALARQLTDEPAVAATRTALLARAIDLEAAEPELLSSLRSLIAAVEGRPVRAARVAEDLQIVHRYGKPLPDPAAALAAVRALGDHGGFAEGLVATGLATAVGARQNWPDPCREAVLALRRHAEPEVREAAYAIVLDRCDMSESA